MIFLSAQPDQLYFRWQLELQLRNFRSLNIKPDNIHVLISFNPKNGINRGYSDFQLENAHLATIFFYPDNRKNKNYAPSIRPHLIKQHFLKFPQLSKSEIFYHDSDIIFRELPDLVRLCKDEVFYLSDTRNYLSSKYILSTGSENLFHRMCNIIGISQKLVMDNDDNAGGAQYLLKATTSDFWEKVERDSNSLFELLTKYNRIHADRAFVTSKKKRSQYGGIQAWCADMWSILWNLIKLHKLIKIHPDLDFCWPSDNINEWRNKKILHYAGQVEEDNLKAFRKLRYTKYPPYFDPNISLISKLTCSYPLRQLILSRKKEIINNSLKIRRLTFLIPIRIDSQSRLSNFYTTLRYLNRFFNANVEIIEFDRSSKISRSRLPNNVSHTFIKDINPYFHRTKANNILIQKSHTKFISLYDADVIIPVAQILSAYQLLENDTADMVIPYDGRFVSVDILFKEMFSKILEDSLLEANLKKFLISSGRSVGGAVFIDRQKYIDSGMENENFTSWGPEDLERYFRFQHLGHRVMKIEGCLFHLYHDRLENSGYQDAQIKQKYKRELLKVCNFEKGELQEYIKTIYTSHDI